MADSKISALPILSGTPVGGDVIAIVNGGITKQITQTTLLSATQTLTNKTINASTNTITNIGSSEIKAEIISGQTLVTAFTGDMVLIQDATDGNLKRVNASDFLGVSPPFSDATPLVKDEVDATKLLRFDLGGMNTGITGQITAAWTFNGVVTIPDASGIFVLDTLIQTLTNKTLTTPKIIDPIVFNEVTFDMQFSSRDQTVTGGHAFLPDMAGNQGDIVIENLTQTLTSKTISAGPNTITGIGSSEVVVDLISGQSLVTAATGDMILVQDSTDSLLKRVDANDFLSAGSPPFTDTNSIVEGSVDATKELRFEVDGNTTGITGVISTIFTSARTITLPDATDTLVGKATTDTFTNKTIDANGIGNVITNIGDAEIESHTSSKITITTKGQLNSNIVYTDQANIYGDFDQTFLDNRLRIQNPAATFDYIFSAPAILGNRALNLPLLTGPDTLVTQAHPQVMINKTINASSNTITNIGDTHITAHTTTKITITAKGQLNSNIVYTDQANTFGNFDQIFTDNKLRIQNPAATFHYTLVAAAIVADRNLIFPLLTGNDTVVTEAFGQTLTNKTLTAPTLNMGTNPITWDTDGHDITPGVTSLTYDLGAATDDHIFQTGGITRATISDTILNVASGVKVQENGVNISPIGTHDLFYHIGAFKETTTNGASAVASEEIGGKEIQFMAFSATLEQHATTQFVLPRNWGLGTIRIQFHYYGKTTGPAGGNTIRWAAKAVALDQGDLLSTAYPAETVMAHDPGAHAADDFLSSAFTSLTISGTPSDGDLIFLDIARRADNAGDDYEQIVHLVGITVQITTNTSTAS